MHKEKGFTLIEVIGVLAVIAIIASVATPRIFSAIEDSRVTSLVQQANSLKVSVANFYKDTGIWPTHYPDDSDDKRHQLMLNKGADGNPISGWDGPYLDQEIKNPITPDGAQFVLVSSAAAYACDLDGNGVQDGNFIIYRVDGITDSVAKKASNILDKDASEVTGDSSWKKAGRVKRYGGTSTSILVFCLGRV